MFSLRCYVALLRTWRRRCFHGINAMILCRQISDVIANENARYKRNELEFKFNIMVPACSVFVVYCLANDHWWWFITWNVHMSILLIKSELKWCIHLSRSHFLYYKYLLTVWIPLSGHGTQACPLWYRVLTGRHVASTTTRRYCTFC